ncbi:MAG: hypothetical protein ABIS07_18030 [Dokdonella sp.]
MHSIRSRVALCVFSLFLATPALALTWHPNVPDQSFNNGLVYVDRFAAPSSHNMVSERMVMLGNGDVVVAGRVTYLNPTDPANPMWLGLVRYNAAGQRVTWGSGPDTTYTYFNRQYVIYPKGSAARFTRVADIIEYGNFLYVLAEGPASVGGGQRNVSVIVFRQSDGEFQGIYNAFARSEDEYGAGLVAIDAAFNVRYLLAIGTKVSASGVQRPTFRRFNLNASTGGLTEDNSIDPGNGGYRDLVFPDVFCNTGACSGSAYAVKSFGGGAFRLGIYVGGTLLPNSGITEFLLLKVKLDGSLDNGFNGNGMKRVSASDANINPDGMGYVYDVAVVPGSQADAATDRVYALASRDDDVLIESSIAKVHGDGTLDPAFGYIGKGYASVGLNRARSIVVIGNDIVVGGQKNYGGPNPLAALAVVDANLSNPLNSQPIYITPYAAKRADGSVWGASIFYDMAVRSGSRLVATGDVRDDSAGGTLMFGTVGIVVDKIFANGFEQ